MCIRDSVQLVEHCIVELQALFVGDGIITVGEDAAQMCIRDRLRTVRSLVPSILASAAEEMLCDASDKIFSSCVRLSVFMQRHSFYKNTGERQNKNSYYIV